MKSYKRIIAGFLAIATLSVNIITASAELSSEPDKVSFWVRWMHAIAVRSDGMKVQDIPVGRFLAAMVSDMSHGTVCELSDDHWHHADESDYVKVSEGKDGTYGVRAKCKYCHKEFAVGGLTADDLSSKYNDYVSSLPASGYTSAGGLLWQPRWIEDTSTWKLTAWFDSANTPFIGPAVFKFVHPSKAMLHSLTLAGIVILFNCVQSLKAKYPIFLSLLPPVTVIRFLHWSNTISPMDVIPSIISTFLISLRC